MTSEEFIARRKAFGLGVKEIARELGVEDRTVRRWEAGDRSVPAMVELIFGYWDRDVAEGRARICFVE